MSKPPFATVDAGETSSFGAKVRSGLRWSVLNLVIGKGLSIASGIVLARILVPQDFGTYAIAIAIVNVLFGLNDLGVVVAIIRWPGDLRLAARTAMTLSTVFSVVLYALCFLAAPPFAAAMGTPDAAPILRLLAVTIVIDGLVSVPHALLVRNFRQDRMTLIQSVSTPANFGTAIVLATLGAGAWSLAVGQVTGNVVACALYWWFSPLRTGFGFDMATARRLLTFGVPLALTSVVEYTLLNADYVIVGATAGAAATGVYLLAYNMSNWVVAALTDTVRPVALAGFAHLSGTDGSPAHRSFSRAFVLLMTVAIPLTAMLAVLAPEVVGLVYGRTWAQSAGVLRFLAVLGAVRVALGLVFDLLAAEGRSRTTLRLHCGWLVALVPALVVGTGAWGVRGAGAAHATVALVVALPLFLRAVARFGVDLAGLARRLGRPVVGGAVAATVGLLVSERVDGDLTSLVVVVPTMMAVYVLIVVPRALLRPSRWSGLLRRGQLLEPSAVVGAAAEA